MFHVGQLVVFVESDSMNLDERETAPRQSGVYTVRGIQFDRHNRPGLFLEEIVNPPVWHNEGTSERAFFARRFRPVDDSKLEIFRAMLTDKPLEVVE